MVTIKSAVMTLGLIMLLAAPAICGPYAPAAGKAGSTAVSMDDPAFIDWASGWIDYLPGAELSSTWMNPQEALGPPEGNSFDVVSLGRGGEITLTFDPPLKNGPQWDFAVFENSFSDTFLELAYVEVSSDGEHFVRFDNDSLTVNPVGGYGAIDPTNIDGFAGKYRQGFGTPFDLADLAGQQDVQAGLVDLNEISYVRIIDIIGDGTYFDTSGDVIWDPYPTVQSAGFDLDAVGGRYHQVINSAPAQPTLLSPENGSLDVMLDTTLVSDTFLDENSDDGDFHDQTHWQVSRDSGFSDLVINLRSSVSLTSLVLSGPVLDEDQTYFWRVRYIDSYGAASDWAETYTFRTTAASGDDNGNGIPDVQELEGTSTVDLNADGIADVSQINEQFKVLDAVDGSGPIGLETTNPNDSIERIASVEPDTYPAEGGDAKPEDILFGLLGFRLRLQNAGDAATIVVYFSEALPDEYQWYKYDPVKGWHLFSGAAFSADRRSLTFTVQDGGDGDADGLVNAIIVDPAGAGANPADEVTIPGSGSAGISGSSGACFVAAAADASGPDDLNLAELRRFFRVFIFLLMLRVFYAVRNKLSANGNRCGAGIPRIQHEVNHQIK